MKNRKQPELRFDNFSDEWKIQVLRDVVERVTRKNKELQTQLPLTISAQYGLVDQISYFNKQVASKDMSNYFLLKRGEFAYNKSYSRDYPWGAIKRLENYDMGALSSLYITFKPLKIDSNFLVSYYDTNKWHKEVSTRATEGARNHGLLNISANDFLETEIVIPLQEEQKVIGLFFKTLDETITLQQQELETLKQTKQGFLQKMFPKEGETVPELRFPEFDEDWQLTELKNVATFINGRAYKQNELLESGKYKVLRVGNFYTNTSWYYSNLELGDKYYANKGDLLYTWSASFGPHIWEGDKVIYHYHIWKVELENNFDKQFIVQLLEYDKAKIISDKNGSTMVHITKKGMEEKVVLLPRIEEQIKIGEFLKKLDKTIELHEKELEALKETKKAFLQKMFV